MSDVNSVVLIGRLTRDGDLRYTNSGTALTKGSIAVNRRVKKGDEWTDEVSYFDFNLWGKRAESLKQYLTKGKQICITGELIQNRWQTEDGQNRSKVEVSVKDIQLIGGRSDTAAPEQAAPPAGDFEDDIPF